MARGTDGEWSQQEAESAGKAGLLEQERVGMPAGSEGCAVGRHGCCPRLSFLSCHPQPALSDDTQTCPWFELRSPLASRGVMLGPTDRPSRGLGMGGQGVSPSCQCSSSAVSQPRSLIWDGDPGAVVAFGCPASPGRWISSCSKHCFYGHSFFDMLRLCLTRALCL